MRRGHLTEHSSRLTARFKPRSTAFPRSYPAVRNAEVAAGSFFSADDVERASRVVVLGDTLASDLFPDGDAVGRSVRLNTQPFTVVGVLASDGGSSFQSSDDSAFIPLPTLVEPRHPVQDVARRRRGLLDRGAVGR